MERRSSLSAERFGDTAHQCEAVEVEALCRLIVAKAREAGLRIGDNDNW
jgi:DNA polymerase III delta subunit